MRSHQASESLSTVHQQKYQDRMKKAREENDRKKKFTERGEVMPSELVRKNQDLDIEQHAEEYEQHSRRSLTPSPQRQQNQEELGIVNLGFGGEQEEVQKEEEAPLLFVDVNLGVDAQERIVVFAGDTAEELAL